MNEEELSAALLNPTSFTYYLSGISLRWNHFVLNIEFVRFN